MIACGEPESSEAQRNFESAGLLHAVWFRPATSKSLAVQNHNFSFLLAYLTFVHLLELQCTSRKLFREPSCRPGKTPGSFWHNNLVHPSANVQSKTSAYEPSRSPQTCSALCPIPSEFFRSINVSIFANSLGRVSYNSRKHVSACWTRQNQGYSLPTSSQHRDPKTCFQHPATAQDSNVFRGSCLV